MPIEWLPKFLPATSLLRSGDPAYLFVIPLLMSILESFILLQLALRSIGVIMGLKQIVLPGCLQGISVFLARQIIPIPFHLLVVIVIVAVIVWRVGNARLSMAAIAALFTESVVIVGSIFVAEPILMLTHPKSTQLLNSVLGFSLGTIIELIIPTIVLIVFVKNRFVLGGRAGKSSSRQIDSGHENRQV